MECCHPIEELETKIKTLNNKARLINRNFFVFDEFKLKKIPNAANDEVIFWYLIINLYGAFFDAGKYIRDLNEWDSCSSNRIKAFYDALNEVRSVFCHNKTKASYLSGKIINKKLDELVPDWSEKIKDGVKHLIDQKFVSESPYKDLYDLFFMAGNKIFELIDQKLLESFEAYKTVPNADTKLYENWFMPIFNWYRDTTVVYTRAYKAFCRENSQRLQKEGKISDTDDDTIENFVSMRKIRLDKDKINGDLNNRYAEGIYYAYFSLNASTTLRKKITPQNVLLPFLNKEFFNIPLPDEIK